MKIGREENRFIQRDNVRQIEVWRSKQFLFSNRQNKEVTEIQQIYNEDIKLLTNIKYIWKLRREIKI